MSRYGKMIAKVRGSHAFSLRAQIENNERDLKNENAIESVKQKVSGQIEGRNAQEGPDFG